MKIGFYMKWVSERNRRGNRMVGEELYFKSLCKFLRKIKGVGSAELYSPDFLPKKKLDFMVYLDEDIHKDLPANKNILYIQNTCGDLGLQLKNLRKKNNYDGYIFISETLLEMNRAAGLGGLFLPFGFDPSVFYPKPKKKEFDCDVCYIGNDVKGEYRTNKYLLPAADFDFRLYGSWGLSRKQKIKKMLSLLEIPRYKKIFMKISRGRIEQEDVPSLYRSAKINLNCTQQGGIDWNSTTLRPSEILACKGFLITDRMPSLEKIKGGLVFTKGGNDLREKIRYYLDHDKEREKIAKKGYQYVVKNEKIEIKARELFNYLLSLK